MVKVMYSVDGKVGQDVEMIANYGDGGVLIEFSNGKRELVGRSTIDFNYFAAEKKPAKGGIYTGPIPEVGEPAPSESYLEEWPEVLSCGRGDCTQPDVDNVDETELTYNIIRLLEQQLKERDEELVAALKENAEIKKTIEAAEDRLAKAGKDMVETIKESIRQQNEVEKQLKRANRIIDFIIQK
jgi:hypothetical protein